MFDLGKLVFDHIFQLIVGVIDDKLKSSALSFLEQRKIRNRVENATADVVESLIPFLEQEKISQDKQQRLIETCVRELRPFTEDPAELFRGSLDGQKIFDTLYHDKELPQVIVEDGLKDTYSLLFPRIATLLCKIPAAVKDWENEAWSENYRRFDEVVAQLKALFAQVDELASAPKKGADKTLNSLKRTLFQKVGLELDITGLRADKPYSGNFDSFFVLPEIKQNSQEKDKKPISISEAGDCFCTFTNSGCLAIVVGAPGAGKSTWSKWLQKQTLNADWAGIGVRIEFRNLKSENLPSVNELVRQAAGVHLAEDMTADRIRTWLDNYHIVFIFDGFDEVKPTDRDRFVNWVKEVSEFAKGCPVVITSRPLTTNHLEMFGENWQKWIIEPFDETRIITYISKWYANSPLLNDNDREIDSKGLALGWLRDPTIGQLTGNPLLLSTLLMVHHLDGKLPNGRANLYKRYVDGMLGIWDDRHKLAATDTQLTLSEKRKIIRGIALYLFLSENETIDENILIEWLEKFLLKINIKASAADVLLILRERSGLIIGPGVYSFAHKTIAEFLVAETILQGDQQDNSGKRIDRFHLFENRKNDRWNTVLFLWAGIASYSDVESFTKECANRNEWDIAYGLLLDQYERYPTSVKREFLVKVVSTGNNMIFEAPGTYACIYEPSDENNGIIKALRVNIRGISVNSLENLLQIAIKDGVLKWQDFKNAQGKIYNLLWIALMQLMDSDYSIMDKRSWKEAILAKPKAIQSTYAWKITLANWLLTFTHKKQEYFDYSVATYIETFPDDCAIIVLVSLSVIAHSNNDIVYSYLRHSEFRIEKYFNLFEKLDVEQIGENYLKNTTKWKTIFTDKTYDPLIESRKVLKKLINDGKIEESDAKKTLDFVTQLIRKRKQIISNKVDESK